MSRGAKIGLGVLVSLLLLVFVVVPIVIGLFAKDKVLNGIQEAVNAPVRASSVSINLLPPGASISALEIGDPDPAASGQPLVKIDSLKVSVSWGTVFGSGMDITGCTIHGLNANISVDEKGVSSLTKLIENMPPSKRTTNLPIGSLVLKNLKTHVFLPGKSQPDATLAIDYARVGNLELAAPGMPLGREVWSDVDVEGVRLTAPTQGEDKHSGGIPDGIYVGQLEAHFAQSPSAGQPIKVKSLAISDLQVAQVYTTPGVEPASRRASVILPLGLKPSSKGGKAEGVPELLVDKLTLTGKIETRGTDANGAPAFWRLNALKGDAANLAFGPGVVAPGAGHLTLNSPTEASTGAGTVALELKEITGSYPNWTFQCSYKLDGMAATAFSVPAQHSSGSGIKSGTISMDFAGPAQNGRLQIDGGITLSKDLEVTGVNNHVAKIVRGEPIRTVRIRGTLANPDVQFPDAFSGLAEKMFKSILTGGPLGVLDAAGGFMGTSVEQGVREATKGVEKGKELIKKVPGLKDLFGK